MKKRALLTIALLILFLIGAAVALWWDDLSKLRLSRFPSRAAWQLPGEVLERLAVEAGDRVADLGSGDGYFTFYLAEAVGPTGKVYAVDVDEEALQAVREGAAQRGLHNVLTVLAETDDPGLPDGSIDLVLVCNVYHHLDGRETYFADLRRDLSSRGRVAVVEPRDQGFARLVSPPGHATPLATLHREMAAAGYEVAASFDFLPVQHLELFAPITAAEGEWRVLFDGGDLEAWEAASDADWTVTPEGVLRATQGEVGLLHTREEYGDFELQVEFRAAAGTNSGLFLRSPPDCRDPAAECYELNIAPPEHPFPTGSLVARERGSLAPDDVESEAWRRFEVRVVGGRIEVGLDGEPVLDYLDPEPLPPGVVGLQFNQGRIEFRSIRIRPLDVSR